MFIPLGVAFLMKEFNPFWDFLISLSFTGVVGFILIILFPFEKDMSSTQAFIAVSLSWVLASLFGAIPLWLSGHFLSFLDAVFEAMSGFATTGLSLMQDIDHASFSVHVWRHLMMFLGGQGIVIIALSFLIKASGTALGLYIGEARDEKILPNIIDTARFIWAVSFVYLIVGVCALTVFNLNAGLGLVKSLLHGFMLFMAAFDTGGFTPQSMSILYYHSFAIEITTVVLMILGSLNFNLHYCLWMRRKKELFKNIETRIFFISFTILFSLLNVFVLLASRVGVFRFVREGFYQLISAHSGCGFTNLYSGALNSWSDGALLMLILAMAFGGGVCSTTGGIKLMRLGLMFKGAVLEIKEKIFPQKAVFVEKYHHISSLSIDDKKIRGVFFIFLMYLVSYLAGAIIGVFCGYNFLPALFESTSAAANVGLSLGITSSSMPMLLKITYIIQMWTGRLEFVAVIVSFGFVFTLFKK